MLDISLNDCSARSGYETRCSHDGSGLENVGTSSRSRGVSSLGGERYSNLPSATIPTSRRRCQCIWRRRPASHFAARGRCFLAREGEVGLRRKTVGRKKTPTLVSPHGNGSRPAWCHCHLSVCERPTCRCQTPRECLSSPVKVFRACSRQSWPAVGVVGRCGFQ